MASGKVHNSDSLKLGVVLYPFCFLTYYIFTKDIWESVFYLIIGFLGLFLVNPDVDQTLPNASQYKLMQNAPYVGFTNLWFWHFYAEIFKHRSFFSHYPVIGTLIRLLYIIARINFTIVFLKYSNFYVSFLDFSWQFSNYYWPSLGFYLIFFIPWFLNDYLHWLRDDRGHIELKNSLDLW